MPEVSSGTAGQQAPLHHRTAPETPALDYFDAAAVAFILKVIQQQTLGQGNRRELTRDELL